MVIQHRAFDQEFARALPALTIPSCTRHHRRTVDVSISSQSYSAPSLEELEIGVILRAWRVRLRAHRPIAPSEREVRRSYGLPEIPIDREPFT
jgi:hypothetical protein